ncbi:4'-phosphopantetheinyl transferase superfamily protein [Actinomycetaceae bacterium MB13-C1-2]|nr:4'-phosphopantetheinyl transferase superfamily protein [Actinomycetaceae bacterium MB13-C1-2]
MPRGAMHQGRGAVLGVGTDLVHIPSFAAQLDSPGTRFANPGGSFTARELRRARARAGSKGDSEAAHIAAIWAIKESVIKAWVSALESIGTRLPMTPDEVVWSDIEVIHSVSGAPSVRLRGRMAEAFGHSIGNAFDGLWRASASHDGDYAQAYVVLSG